MFFKKKHATAPKYSVFFLLAAKLAGFIFAVKNLSSNIKRQLIGVYCVVAVNASAVDLLTVSQQLLKIKINNIFLVKPFPSRLSDLRHSQNPSRPFFLLVKKGILVWWTFYLEKIFELFINLFLVSNFRRKRLSFYRLKHVFKTESMIEHDSDPEKG